MAKILIVDDEKSIRITLREYLEKEGYNISLAQSANECLKLLNTYTFDVVVSDIILPGMDGIKLLQKIRGISADIQIIMITGEPTIETAADALRAGALDYLQKPVSGMEITKVVANALRVKDLIDKKNKAEQINQKYQQKLEEMVSSRTLELHKSYRKLEKEIIQKEQAQEELSLRVAALESAANAIVITDDEGIAIWINKAFTKLTGYNPGEVINRKANILRSGEHNQTFYNDLWSTIKSGKVWQGEIVNKRKDDSLYTEEMTITPVKNDKGKIEHFIAIKDDISQRKHLEAQIQQSQKLESIGTLAGGIAHDFNNLLTIINGYAELSMQRIDSSEPLHANIQAIKQAGEKAEYMTRQLLAFSRKQIFQPKIIDLNNLIKNQDKLLRRLIGEDIRIETKLNSDAVNIKADPGQIEQIFMNLTINARDAINEKDQRTEEKKITITTGQVWIDEEFAEKHIGSTIGKHVFFTVKDTGIGMSSETISKIFEPFFTTKAEGKGTGLGLSTVYGIVKQNGGNLFVNSMPGQGTTFKILWPATQLDRQPEKTSIDKDVPHGTETILLVEDDNGLREFSKIALQSLGYKICLAANGKEALEYFISEKLKGKIDLLFTDIVMPEMGGYELAGELSKLDPDLKILYASGHTEENIVNRGELKQGLSFIQKPFTITVLAKKIRKVLEN